MHDVLRQSRVIARKEHVSEGSDYFDFALKKGVYDIQEFKEIGMTDDEIKSILDAQKRNWKIEKGEKYFAQTGVYDGDLYDYKCILAIHDICVKYELYRDED